jgi:hypothetical protein
VYGAGGVTAAHRRDRLSLDGKLVAVSSLVAKPSYTLLGRTVVGAAGRDDWAGRGALLRGNRLDLYEGEQVTVLGVLRVIDDAPNVVNQQFVPRWSEIRAGG